MIVKDEEKSLPQCLDSVKGVVDEIVVLDTGSSDRTPEIAQAFGATVHYFEWCNDFAAARNEALKYVTGDWVLILDADETLDPAIVAPLRVAILNENLLVVNLVRQEIGATQTPYSLTSRLFRNHPELKFSRPYHAIIDDSVMGLMEKEKHWEILSLPGVAVLHSGYSASAIAAKDKFSRAQQAMETYIKDHPDDSYACNKLGALYVQMGQIDQGIELLERGLNDYKADPLVCYELNYHLANAYQRKQNANKAVIHYQAALAQDIMPPLKLGAYNNLGALLQNAGEYEMAERAFGATIAIDPTFVKGYFNVGAALKAQGNYKDAIQAYEEAIKLQPDYAEAYQNLGVVWIKCGQMQKGLEYISKAIALLENSNLLEAQRLRQMVQDMGFELPKVKVNPT